MANIYILCIIWTSYGITSIDKPSVRYCSDRVLTGWHLTTAYEEFLIYWTSNQTPINNINVDIYININAIKFIEDRWKTKNVFADNRI